jgi:hypothetical protein
MGGFKKTSFADETSHLDKTSPEYTTVKLRHDAVEQAKMEKQAYNRKLIRRIMDLSDPVKRLNVTRLNKVGTAGLIAIGKALKTLNEELKSAGMRVEEDKASDKWT